MNRAFFIIVTPAALVVLGYCLVFRHAGITLPVGELLVPLAVLLGAAGWILARKKSGAKEAPVSPK